MALTTKHLFPFLKLMRALNIKDEFKAIYRQKHTFEGLTEDEIGQQVDDKGIDLIFLLMEKFPNAEKEIKAFLAIYADKSAEEMDNMPVDEFFALIKQFLKEPAFKSFFSQAVK
jgi:hypothetical protein